MHTILLAIQVLLAISIIVLVLIQHGKGADAGAAFGSGASGTVFGSHGSANFLSRATAVLAALFFAISLGLAYLVQSGGPVGGASVVDQMKTPPAVQQQKKSTPSVPEPSDVIHSSPAPKDAPQSNSPTTGQGAGQSGSTGNTSGASENIPQAPPANGGSSQQ